MSKVGHVSHKMSTKIITNPVNFGTHPIKCEGTVGEGLDYRSLGLGIVQKVNRYKDIHIRPIDDGLAEGTEKVTIRIIESDEYVIDPQYVQATFDILDGAKVGYKTDQNIAAVNAPGSSLRLASIIGYVGKGVQIKAIVNHSNIVRIDPFNFYSCLCARL